MSDSRDRQVDSASGGEEPKRRIFLVKNRFQTRFALFPLAFFLLFLIGAGGYLWWFINDTLNYYIYMPHCRIDNIWPEVSPAIVNTALVGGGAFLVALAAWTVSRYRPLKRDIAKVDEWSARFDPALGDALKAGIKDHEVRLLAARLVKAAERFEGWEKATGEARAEFLAAARKLEGLPDAEFIAGVAELRDKWRNLWDEVNHVRIDERFS